MDLDLVFPGTLLFAGAALLILCRWMTPRQTIKVKLQDDGTLLEVLPDGRERPLEDKTDWARLRTMTDDDVLSAAIDDPDARPVTEEESARAKRIPRTKTLRRALGLTQEAFAARFQIPLGTLRDWEQGKSEPDQSAKAYLRAIAGDATTIQRALQAAPRP